MSYQLACVFPGQGSQSVGMLAELANEPIIRATFNEAAEVLNYDLWQLIQQGPKQQLDQTEYTQPAMLVADIALYRLWQERHHQTPEIVAGHSLGEYAALVAAQAIAFKDAVALVRARGQIMQASMPLGAGAMAAIVGLTDQQIQDICLKVANGEVVEAANFNAIGQTVIAGHAAAVQRALELAEQDGAKLAVLIPVSVPCHCKLLLPAAQEFAKFIADIPITTPKIMFINNADVELVSDPENIRNSLIRQLHQPVRWVEIIQYFQRTGVEMIMECGPGQVLTGLTKRIERSLKTQTVMAAL